MAYMHEREGRGKARALVAKTGYSPVGGHFKLGGNSDAAADAKMVTKGVHEHEGALHKGSPKTRLTFAEGGMAGMPRLDQKSRGGGGSKRSSKGHGNTINIAVVPHAGGGQPPPAAAAPHPPMPVVPPRPPLVGPPGGGMPPGMPPGGAPPIAAGAAPPVAMPRPPMAPPPGLPPGVMPPRPPIRTGGRLARGGAAKNAEIAKEAKEEGESYAEEKREQREGKARGGRASGGASDPLDSLDFKRESHARGGRTSHSKRMMGPDSDATAMIKNPPRLDIGNTTAMSAASPQLENALAASNKQMLPHQQDQDFQPPPIQKKSGGEVGSGRVAGIDAGSGSGRGRLEKSRSAPGVEHGGIGRA